jgi:hypothetical protein
MRTGAAGTSQARFGTCNRRIPHGSSLIPYLASHALFDCEHFAACINIIYTWQKKKSGKNLSPRNRKACHSLVASTLFLVRFFYSYMQDEYSCLPPLVLVRVWMYYYCITAWYNCLSSRRAESPSASVASMRGYGRCMSGGGSESSCGRGHERRAYYLHSAASRTLPVPNPAS